MGSAWNLRRLLTGAALVAVAAVLVGVPLAASANPDIDGFELDGNAAGNGANDWDSLGGALRFTGFRADPTDDSDTGYGSGQTKDTKDVSQWTWEQADVTPAKSDIVHDYASVYVEDGNLILYFGQNRQLDRSGDANVGFWFLQNDIGLSGDGSFSGTHAEGDLLVQSEFTNGGDVSGIRVYKWQGGGITEVTSNVGECAGGKLATLDACAIVNTGTISTSWAGSITSPYFYEGGVNLSALFPQSVPCFSSFLTNTRTSQSESADLKDFGLGDIDTCASLKITKQATPSDGTQFGYSTTGGLDPGTFSLASGGSRDYTKLQPGQYSVTENAPPAGWALDNLSCPVATGPGTSVNVNGATASITLGFVGHVECTYVNKRQPHVRVVKDLEPASDTGKFDLRINGTTRADDVGDSGDTGFVQVAPGQVTVDELAGAGTVLANYASSIACDSGKGSASGTSHAFSVDFGDQVTCTITNARKGNIVVEKQTSPDGAAQVFTFNASYDGDGFSLADGQSNDSGPLSAGTYSVSENVPAGWSLASATCDDGSAPSAIALAAGETVKCTFMNAKDGQVVVRKVMVGGTDTFDFSGTPAGSISANNGTLTQSVAPGQYVSTEAAKAGWDLVSVACSDGNSSGSVPNRQATFNVEPGETVTCTFTNRKQSRIVVEKQTSPDGDAQVFGFTASYDADGFSLSDGQQSDSGPLAPGTYSVAENVPAGWDLESAVCSDQSPASAIALAAGETVTCVFTNEKDARIVVEKQTSPDGAQQSFTFTRSYGASFQLSDGQQHDSGDLDPGTYSVAETVPAGWTLTSAVCSDQSPANAIQLAAGETVTCVFTNTIKPGKIVVEKQTLPDGDSQSFAFAASYDGDGFSLSDGQQSDSGPLAPGTYSVSETVPAGWDLKSAVCSDGSPIDAIAVAPDETVTCVFTNEKDARIVVEKQTNPDGDPQVFGFSASYDGDGFSLADGQQSDSGDLDPGTYSVSESVPAGWDLESIECSDGSPRTAISLQAGEVVTCVFTNEKDARILVEKQTLPNGDPQSFHFDADYDGNGFDLVDNGQNDSGDLDPGTYEVSEDVPAGWDLTSAVCSDESEPESIELAAGEVVTCVFTNTKRGSIVVEKQTSPNGAPGTFTFSGDAAGAISDNGKITVANLAPGTYTSTEAAAPGYDLTSIQCSDGNSSGSVGTRTATFALEAGETVTCVFTNTLVPTVTGQGSIDVQKSADPTSVKEPGGPVSFTVTITNTSSIGVTITNVVDSVFGDLDDTDGSGVFDVPINLAPGEKVSKTFQRPVTGSAGQVHTNVVTASGTDQAGNPVSDSDDARVEITPRLIDLVIVKTATSPTPLNGTVRYTLTVTNKGPDTATNVQVADPAPSGVSYLTANASKGSCNLSASLVTCSLGNLAAGESVRIDVTARATAVGTHTNVATVTGGGGRETNPADNVDDAVTIVPAPFIPPSKPKPAAPKPVCLTLTVSPKMIKADGRPDRVAVKVTAGAKRVKGTKVTIFGAGVRESARSNGKGMAYLRINPRKPGLITITALETNQRVCGPKRIGVVGVFLPPLTG